MENLKNSGYVSSVTKMTEPLQYFFHFLIEIMTAHHDHMITITQRILISALLCRISNDWLFPVAFLIVQAWGFFISTKSPDPIHGFSFSSTAEDEKASRVQC